jgi:hypothetical protein
MATVSKFPRQLAPTVGQSAVASGVKFRPGPSGEKVASGLVWRFGTFDCVDDNLAHFELRQQRLLPRRRQPPLLRRQALPGGGH